MSKSWFERNLPALANVYRSTIDASRRNSYFLGLVPNWRTTPWWPADTIASRQRGLLNLIQVAHQEKIDLAPLVANMALEERGWYRRTLVRLANRLASGTPLASALEQTPGALHDDAVLAIRFATQTGVLSSILTQLCEDQSSTIHSPWTHLKRASIYYGLVAFIIFLAVLFNFAVIGPTFTKMAEEFGIANHNLKWMRTATEWIFQFGPAFVLMLALGLLVVGSPAFRLWIYQRVLRGRIPQTTLTRKSQFFRYLATSVEAGRPVPTALSTLARYHFDKSLRSRLLVARNDVEQGVETWQSLKDAQLINADELATLSSAQNNDVRVWLMRKLATQYNNRFLQRISRFVDVGVPLLVIFFGVIVFWIWWTFFGFLLNLTNSLL